MCVCVWLLDHQGSIKLVTLTLKCEYEMFKCLHASVVYGANVT